MKKLSIAQPILVGLAALFVAAAAVASMHKTKVTFSESVRVPGATLSAGTYYFMAPEHRNRALVRIVDKDRNLVTQFMGSPATPVNPITQSSSSEIMIADPRPSNRGPILSAAWSFDSSIRKRMRLQLQHRVTSLSRKQKRQ